MLTDFPELQLRTSAHTMATLEQYEEKELENILKNCHSDLRLIRGMPSAEFGIFAIAKLVERVTKGKLDGYHERCHNDTDLKRDIEAEISLLFGGFGRRMNILFRFLNNAWKQLYDPNSDYNNWEGHEEYEQEMGAKRDQYVRTIPPDGARDEAPENERPRKRTRTSSAEDPASHTSHSYRS